MELSLKSVDNIKLFVDKKNCCGCGACMNTCFNHAISMQRDEYGFIYPVIDERICSKCGLCTKVCRYQKVEESNIPIEAYAAITKDEQQLLKSASGGIFAAFATFILDNDGVVFGAAMEYIDAKLTPIHIAISNKKDLIRLQGSKYVQSYIGNTYMEAKELLLRGRTVMFSGTPCQIAGLHGFLKMNYERLITLDIICHGVPNAVFFDDYIRVLENRLKGKIIDFKFRDKTYGWGYNGKAVVLTKKSKVKEKLIPKQISSYYKYFLNSDVCRESCYSCKYTSLHRPGDITIGDYWGVQKEHPELMKDQATLLLMKKGISCIIVNTQIGKEYLESIEQNLNLYLSTFDKVARGNNQLNIPSLKGNNREKILELFSKNGYEEVEKYYRKQEGLKLYYYELMNVLPPRLQKIIMKVVGKLLGNSKK